MYLGFWRIIALKPAPLLEVGRKCVSELSNSGPCMTSIFLESQDLSHLAQFVPDLRVCENFLEMLLV